MSVVVFIRMSYQFCDDLSGFAISGSLTFLRGCDRLHAKITTPEHLCSTFVDTLQRIQGTFADTFNNRYKQHKYIKKTFFNIKKA